MGEVQKTKTDGKNNDFITKQICLEGVQEKRQDDVSGLCLPPVIEDTHRHICFGRKGQKKGLGRVKQTDERLVRAIHAQQKFALQTRWRTTGVPGVERGLFQRLPQSLQTIIKMLASRLWKILAQSFSTSHDPSPLQHACLFIQYIPRSPGKTC